MRLVHLVSALVALGLIWQQAKERASWAAR